MTYLSKVTFKDPNNAWRELTHEYSLHQKIWELMSESEDQKRDFLYRVVAGNLPTIYIQSKTHPKAENKLFICETRSFSPIFSNGMNLQFNVRINPIISVGLEKDKRSKRHDVVMHKKYQLRERGEPVPPMDELIQDAVGGWISQRQERCGFELSNDSLIYSEYTQRELSKQKASKLITLSTVDISGVFTVNNAERFKEMIETGLGAAKGFGCGLVLIKPAQ